MQNTRCNHPPAFREGRKQSNFGAGAKDLSINSNLNFAKNAISPSQNLQANSTLPRGEGDCIEGFFTTPKKLEGDGTEYIPRIDVEKNYPAIFTFLQKFQNQLEKRADKGDHWTNTISINKYHTSI